MLVAIDFIDLHVFENESSKPLNNKLMLLLEMFILYTTGMYITHSHIMKEDLNFENKDFIDQFK